MKIKHQRVAYTDYREYFPLFYGLFVCVFRVVVSVQCTCKQMSIKQIKADCRPIRVAVFMYTRDHGRC